MLVILAFRFEKSERKDFSCDESASNMWTCFKNQLKWKEKALLFRDTPRKIALIHTTAQHLGITEDVVAVFPIFFRETDSPATFKRALQQKGYQSLESHDN